MPKFRKKRLQVHAEIVTDKKITVETDGHTSIAIKGDVLITGPDGEKYPMKPGRFVRYFDPDPTDDEAAGMIESLKHPKE